MTDQRATLIAVIVTTAIAEIMFIGVAGLTYSVMSTLFFKAVIKFLWFFGSLTFAFIGGRMYGRIELKQELRRAKMEQPK